MSVRMSLCALAATLTLAWLLAAPKPAHAQPQPAESTEQRLRRLEEKIDKLTAPLAEQRGAAPKPVPPTEATVRLVLNARELLATDLETRRQAYEEFRKRTPILLLRTGGKDIYVERLAKIEKRRSDLLMHVEEMHQNHSLLKRTYAQHGRAVALQTMVAMGIKVSGLDNASALDKLLIELAFERQQKVQALGAQHPAVKDLDERIELVKKFYGKGVEKAAEPDPVAIVIAAMQVEVDGKRMLIQTMNDLFEKEQQAAREVTQFELEDARHKEGIESTKRLLEQIMHKVNEITLSGIPRK